MGVLWWIFDFLWTSIGWYLIELLKRAWFTLQQAGYADPTNAMMIRVHFEDAWYTKLLGVGLALVLIYMVGLLVGNFLGRALYAAAERIVMRVPVVRAVYPTFKQITDFVLADRESQFAGSRVVAFRPHSNEIWSLGLVTGKGLPPLDEVTEGETVTVFMPSSPTAFSGYVVIVPRREVIEMPMTVEEAMKLLVSGGVAGPGSGQVEKPMSRKQAKAALAAADAAPPTLAAPSSDSSDEASESASLESSHARPDHHPSR